MAFTPVPNSNVCNPLMQSYESAPLLFADEHAVCLMRVGVRSHNLQFVCVLTGEDVPSARNALSYSPFCIARIFRLTAESWTACCAGALGTYRNAPALSYPVESC